MNLHKFLYPPGCDVGTQRNIEGLSLGMRKYGSFTKLISISRRILVFMLTPSFLTRSNYSSKTTLAWMIKLASFLPRLIFAFVGWTQPLRCAVLAAYISLYLLIDLSTCETILCLSWNYLTAFKKIAAFGEPRKNSENGFTTPLIMCFPPSILSDCIIQQEIFNMLLFERTYCTAQRRLRYEYA